jgi:hypothetical protein
VELAATAAVLAVALVATAAAVLKSAALSRSAAQTRAVARAAASVLEEVRGCRFDELVPTWDGVERSVTGLPGVGSPATAEVDVADAASGSSRWPVYRVVVTLRWQGATGPQTYVASTLLSDRNGNGSGSSVSGGGGGGE